ncbi:MAG TPA: cytochrome c oxidase subunit II [Actinomycetota bacterium]
MLSSCAKPGATEQGQEVHRLYLIILGLGGFVFVLVEGLLLWSIVRFRKRDDTPPPQMLGSNRALVGFFAFGAVIVSVLFPFGEKTLSDVLRQEPALVNLRVEAFQWQWTAFYLNEGIFTTGHTLKEPMVMELPVDEPVHVTLISRDVMHEFFIPDFLFMRNAIPGHPNTFTFTPNKLGTFQAQCAEYCGLWHSRMTFVVKVVTPPDYATWVKNKTLKGIGGNCSPKGSSVHVTAKNTSWNTNCIAIAAGSTLSLTMSNEDAGVEHNFGIWPSIQDAIAKKGQLFQTGKFPGVATKSFQVPVTSTLPPGRYYFQCDVHGVAMAGAFIVK